MELSREIETGGEMHDKLTHKPLVNNKERSEARDACERSSTEEERRGAKTGTARIGRRRRWGILWVCCEQEKEEVQKEK